MDFRQVPVTMHMKKRFNITGICIPEKHYMVDISRKISKILEYIENEEYFIINRPRQYGKTTTLYMLERSLNKMEDYLVISISFEGVGSLIFEEEKSFVRGFMEILSDSLLFNHKDLAEYVEGEKNRIGNFNDLSRFISKFIISCKKNVVLMIDEVDKSSNNQLFLNFLGFLRNKYLLKNSGKDYSFSSVILAGVHDVKSLKLKVRADEEQKYNSPWNIAVDFDVDLSFSPLEIQTMIEDYEKCNDLSMDIEALSERIYYFTGGYPFLVSRICKVIDEKYYENDKKNWQAEDVDKAVKEMLGEVNTLFESLVKNLENNKDLYELVSRILVQGEHIIFNPLDPLINLGLTYGFFKEGSEGVVISNKIFQEVIYNYMISKLQTSAKNMSNYNFKSNFINAEGSLNFPKILNRFQAFMKEQYSDKDVSFIENHGRLLFMAFIKPIINGLGFDFKEVQVSEEKRLDIVIAYNSFRYVVELKIWRGERYHQKGLEQLGDYLDICGLNQGYLIVFNFNNNKEYKEESIKKDNKEIFAVYL